MSEGVAMGVKVLHAADFHLDSAFGALTPEQSRQRRMESRRSPGRHGPADRQ